MKKLKPFKIPKPKSRRVIIDVPEGAIVSIRLPLSILELALLSSSTRTEPLEISPDRPEKLSQRDAIRRVAWRSGAYCRAVELHAQFLDDVDAVCQRPRTRVKRLPSAGVTPATLSAETLDALDEAVARLNQRGLLRLLRVDGRTFFKPTRAGLRLGQDFRSVLKALHTPTWKRKKPGQKSK